MTNESINQILAQVGGIVENFVMNNDFKPTIGIIDNQINELKKKRLLEPNNIEIINNYINYYEKLKRIYEAIIKAQSHNNLNLN